jgi:transcription-repair coupling factor (superfamily II helicase)
MARAGSHESLDEIRAEMRDRFGPVPTLVENLIASMNLRRQMRELMIVSALLNKDQLEIKFHPDAPVETEKLVALANANRTSMRLTPSYQVIVQITVGEYAQIFAQIEAVLQALAACEKLENWPGRSVEPLAN